MSSDRDQLAAVIRAEYDTRTPGRYPTEHALADTIVCAGWRPPAQRIESRDGIADEPTGTVIRFRGGYVGSIDHGPHGEWAGLDTRIHVLSPGEGPYVCAFELPPEEFPVTVLWTPGGDS